jgi:thiamine kinase-like enzyme
LLSEVVCHNDLLSGNIMLDPVRNSVRLIDFEYSGINLAVADVANVFTAVCESIMLSGEPQDVERNFPPRHKQLHFLETYLGHAIPDSEREAVFTVILGFAMADELRWTIWGTIQAEQSIVDFDYVFYYNSRFDAYKNYKRLLEERLAHLT